CKLHRIPTERAKQIVGDVKAQWRKAHPPKPQRKPGDIITNSLGMKFAWIPPGTFSMGCPLNEEDRNSDEAQHSVTLTKGFFMGIHPITQEQWQAVMGNNPSYHNRTRNQYDCCEKKPVEMVTWKDCQQFLKKLRDRDKKKYRLPTEAEWEYACRSGTTTEYHCGESLSSDQASYYPVLCPFVRTV